MTPPGCPPGLEYLAQLDELQLDVVGSTPAQGVVYNIM
jgi:hypothetical protein